MGKTHFQAVLGANLAFPVQHIFIRLVHMMFQVSHLVRRILPGLDTRFGVVQGIRRTLLNMVPRLQPSQACSGPAQTKKIYQGNTSNV